MCSICGMIDFENPNSLDLQILKNMNITMKHRGPDDTGFSFCSFAAFAHNRLAVMDPENGRQPMSATYQGRKYTIIYNGEVYNFKELRADFEKQGICFQTNSDTEVVLWSYIIYKDACPTYLNGIFSFAVIDEAEERVFIARDRFGVKPLFYTQVGSTLLIASEIKALLAHPDVKSLIDRQGIWQLLYLAPTTISGSGVFKNIFEFCPAECGVVTKDGLMKNKYWSVTPKDISISADEAAEETKRLLTDAVDRQLVSDVPLAVLLSGGLDSSIITSVASQHAKGRGRTLSTYSFEYENNRQSFKSSLFQPQGDDDFARYLANYLSTHHTVLTAPTQSVSALLTQAVKARDIPGQADIDSSLLYFCHEIKKNHTVVLSGECADEIFGGYPWFYREEMLNSGFFPWVHNATVRAGLLNSEFADPENGLAYAKDLYAKSVASAPLTGEETPDMKTARIATHLSVNWFMASLLERKDRMSMYSGLEVRVPFADHRILEFVYNVPWSIKFEGNTEKAHLRRAMGSYLPDKILHRKKSPYPKTHDPVYEQQVVSLLMKRLSGGGILSQYLDVARFEDLFRSENTTWFGQLMSRPQLIAWLIQLDFWFEEYRVNLAN